MRTVDVDSLKDFKVEKEMFNEEEFIQDFSQFWLNFKPYKYQSKFLKACFTKKRVAAKWPRQSGKSHTVGGYSLTRAITDCVQIIIVAPTQTQSSELYGKIRNMAEGNPYIKSIITKSTETEMRFANGSRIISLPSGPEGKTIRGFTADIVILEESGFMKDSIVNSVIIPMIASKPDGQIIKIGTPWMKNHFYRSIFEDDNYETVNIGWEECVKEGQYTEEFIEEQKKNLSDIEFRTEYDSNFIEDIGAFFPSKLLQDSMEIYRMLEVV